MRTDRPETITNDTLKKSYWLLGHLMQFKRNTAVIIIALEAIILVLALIQFAGYLYFVIVRNERLIEPLRQNVATAIAPITIPDPAVLSYGAVQHGQGQYDLYAKLKNENQGWRGDVDFIYSVNGVEQPAQHIFLLPLEEKYILKLGILASTTPQISYRIANTAWRRLTQDDVRAIADRNIFEVKDTKIATETHAQFITETLLTFTLANHSVYRFFDFRIPVVVKQGSAVVAVALVPVFSLDRDEEKHVGARWEYALTGTSFDIIPDIDILNPSVVQPAL